MKVHNLTLAADILDNDGSEISEQEEMFDIEFSLENLDDNAFKIYVHEFKMSFERNGKKTTVILHTETHEIAEKMLMDYHHSNPEYFENLEAPEDAPDHRDELNYV